MEYLLLTALVMLISFVFVKVRNKFSYFKNCGVPGPRETPFIGYLGQHFTQKRHMNYILLELNHKYKEAKYIGCHLFLNPLIVIQDPELVKSVLVKNFDHFENRKEFFNEEADPLLGKNLLMKNGEKWRNLRTMLTPSFTSSKMRLMFSLMSNCAEKFTNKFLEVYAEKAEVDMKDAFTKYANDVIATCAFGIECDSLKDPKNEFYVRGRKATNFTAFGTRVKILLLFLWPSLFYKLKVNVIDKTTSKFFVDIISETMRIRDEQGIVRPDMLQLMMETRDKTSHLDLAEMTAQAFIFFVAGLETVSSQMCMLAFELALKPDVQEKLQHEIDALMEETNGKPSYEAINNLKYLDAVLCETLRKHTVANLSRICTKEFELPPAVSGGQSFVVKPGMEIWISTPAIHMNSDYFENPEEFNPDRFLNDAAKKVVASDETHLGFGLGPRMCIGNRFAILETKVLFVYLLSKCTLVPCEKTPSTLEYDHKSFQPAPKGGCWLKIKTRN